MLKKARLKLNGEVRALDEPLADALLRPTRIYVRPVQAVLRRYRRKFMVTALAHITGGGLRGNLPRVLPDDCDIVIRRGSWPVPPIFGLLEHHGVTEEEMYRVFNMGVGMAMLVRPQSVGAVVRTLQRAGEQAFVIGRVRRGRGQVEIR